MKAEELRCGNYIVVNGRTVKVNPNHILHAGYRPDNNYQPIELSPEILEKAGFVDTEADGYYERTIDLPDLIHSVRKVLHLSTNGTDGWAVYLRDEYIALIHNLHQLQNLYYALTSAELPINL